MQFYSADGAPLDGPREWEPSVIDLEVGPGDWESVQFSINDVSVPIHVAHRFGESRTLADWPRSGPGAYHLLVNSPTQSQSRIVTVGSAKLGDDGLAALINDLEQRLPTSITLGVQQAGGLVGLHIRPPSENTIEQELLRVRRAVDGPLGEPGLLWLLPQIAADPHHMLFREDLWVRREFAGRVPVAGLVQTLTRPGNVDGNGRPERVLDSRVRRTVDVYENRLLKGFVMEALGRLRRLERIAGVADSELGTEVHEKHQALQEAERRATFLLDVTDSPHTHDRLTMVLLREPRYRALLDRFREFHHSLWVELADERLDAPLQNLPSLYQSWGSLHVIDALLDVGAELGFRVVEQRIVHRRPGTLFVQVMRHGVAALRLEDPTRGVTVTLTPERSYGRSGDPRSVSFLQRPDVAVEIGMPDGDLDMLLFDPKYKLDADDQGSGLPVKSDVDKMHSYRDAIRDGAGRHVVSFAATLYPGTTQHYGSDIAAIGAVPGRENELGETLRETLWRHIGEARDRQGSLSGEGSVTDV